MPKQHKNKRRDSVSAVGPFARIRIIVTVILILLAFAVIGYRIFAA